jgi:hypothetical protein
MVFPDGRKAIGGHALNARMLVASMAVFQMLQAFPIKGSQTAWSTLPLCVCCLVLLHDGLRELSQRPAGVPFSIRFSVGLAAAITILTLAVFNFDLWNSYLHVPDLGLPGSDRIRLPMQMKSKFDWVAASASRYCDALVTEPGQDSFLLWTERSAELIRKSPVLPVDWPLTLPNDQQLQVVDKLNRTSRTCAVYNQKLLDWWTKDAPGITPANVAKEPLVAYIRSLRAIRKIGDYEIRATEPVAAAWSDDYLLNGVRDINGTRAAIGVPTDLLPPGSPTELTFGFQANRSGPLISIEQPGAGSDDEVTPTERLVYIEENGRLVLRTKPGAYLVTPQATRVLDGQWHELSLRRERNDWLVLLDGVPVGEACGSFTQENPSRYMQLGPANTTNCPGHRSGWSQFFGKLREVRVRRVESSLTGAQVSAPVRPLPHSNS